MRKKNHQVFRHATRIILLFQVFFIMISSLCAQTNIDSVLNKIDPEKWSTAVEKKVSRLEEKIVTKSEKTLRKLEKEEEKVYKKLLSTKDSVTAKTKLNEIQSRYAGMQQKLKDPSSLTAGIKDYVPWLDTTLTALKFLDKQGVSGNVKDALSKAESFNSRLQQADEIKRFIRERKDELKSQLESLGMFNELKKFNKEVYYYSAQIKEYKEILKDPNKIEKKAIELLSKTKVFQEFMKKNSMLASLFRMPGDPNDPSYIASLAGLQTRAQVNSIVQNQLSAGGPGAQQQFSQNLQAAQSQLQQVKDKLNQWGGGSSDDIMPEGFKPNNQRTKSFLHRIELGTNFQTTGAITSFPVTTDIGLSIGYKPNDKSVIGIGGSYKVGWGKGWNDIRITHQGAGIRSFIDWKAPFGSPKGGMFANLWISGGYEQNYKSEIRDIDQLKDISAWQQSGLIGISKVVDVRSKLFKKTKVQLLWDFLSYKQVPVTQSIIFRIGYNLN